jgi:hypothetical protein
MSKIILIGRCCRVTFDIINIGLKGETSLFEWVWTDTLTEINTILEKLVNNTDIAVSRDGHNDWLVDTNIKTCHYIHKDYKAIVDRRAARFLNDIKTNSEILFIRDDVLGTIQYDEIDKFSNLIKQINPDLCFKILLLSKEHHYKAIDYPNVNHRIYNTSMYKTYIDECFAITNYTNICTGDISDGE